MTTLAFDSLRYARKLRDAGVPEPQADVQAELMAEAFGFYAENILTRDHFTDVLIARFSEFGAQMDARFAEQDAKCEKRFTDIDKRAPNRTRSSSGASPIRTPDLRGVLASWKKRCTSTPGCSEFSLSP